MMRAVVMGFVLVGLTSVLGAAGQQAADTAKSEGDAGIYVTTPSGRQALAMEMPSGHEVTGKFRPSMTSTFTGLTADLRVSAEPEFLFVVPRAKSTTDPAEMMRAMTMANTRPDQFVIVRLGTDKFDRVLQSNKAKKIELVVERLTTETYRAKPKSRLEPGEYALCPSYGGQVGGQTWAFGVDK